MKVLLINGSPHKAGCTYTALSEAAKALNSQGVETEIFHIGTKPVANCIACGRCKQTGRCALGGEVNDILERLDEFDGLIVGSPVYYAAASGQITSFLNRLFFAGKGSLRFKPAAAVVSCRRGGASAAFDQLNKYFTISGMPVVSSQYWNQVHGNTPEEVMQDAEGLQTMRSLGLSMAWLLKCIEAGRNAGVGAPRWEAQTPTNFIR